jgi:hypothetical protein
MKNYLHFFLKKLELKFDTILIFMTLYSFIWLKENQWNFGWNFKVCTMNFKRARKRKFIFGYIYVACKVISEHVCCRLCGRFIALHLEIQEYANMMESLLFPFLSY